MAPFVIKHTGVTIFVVEILEPPIITSIRMNLIAVIDTPDINATYFQQQFGSANKPMTI